MSGDRPTPPTLPVTWQPQHANASTLVGEVRCNPSEHGGVGLEAWGFAPDTPYGSRASLWVEIKTRYELIRVASVTVRAGSLAEAIDAVERAAVAAGFVRPREEQA